MIKFVLILKMDSDLFNNQEFKYIINRYKPETFDTINILDQKPKKFLD